MKPQYRQNYIQLKGINQVLNAKVGDAEKILNCRYAPEGGWVGDIGIESWWKFPAVFRIQPDEQPYFTNKVDALYVWRRQGSNDTYTFVEQDGTLYYFLGNKGQGSFYAGYSWFDDAVVIDTKRHIPKFNEAGTQFINLGSRLLILNGYDRALLFAGDGVVREFGFALQTAPPHPIPVDTSYQQGQELEDGTALYFEPNSKLGMGLTDGSINDYSYRVTYIMDSGAESPLSPSQEVSWRIAQVTAGEPPALIGGYKYGVFLEMPIGPEGCVARRVYRTKNITTDGEIYYFVKQIDENSSRMFVDTLPDQYLVNTAPNILASSVIATDYNFGENWDNRLWLAKGNKIIYSDKGIYEQFGAANYFDLGNLVGGDITQLQAFYNNLIVFREQAINIISVLDNGNYTISTITNTTGTTASNAVVVIPQVGVAFFNEEGVWMLTGGLNGGSSLSITKISKQIDRWLDRQNTSFINRTIACYSYEMKEVWFHYCMDDHEFPNAGVVLHLEPERPEWSFRGSPNDDEKSYWTAMCATPDGKFLLGNAPSWTDNLDVGSINPHFGPLQVLSRHLNWGQTAEVKAIEGESVVRFLVTPTPHVGRSWESEWYALNNSSAKTRYYSVELELMSYGDNPFDFTYAIDYSYTDNATGQQKQARSSSVYTANEDAVMGPADASVTKVPFTINSSVVSQGRLIKLRYDVNSELCDQFKFTIKSTNNAFHVFQMNLLTDVVEMPVLNQSTRLQRGQPR